MGADTNSVVITVMISCFLPIFQHNLSTIVRSKTGKYVVFTAQKATPQVLSNLECERASDLDKEV